MTTTATVQPNRNTNAPRFPLWAKIVGAVVILAVVITVAVFAKMGYVPNDLDTSTTLATTNGLFSATYEPQVETIAINQIHTWTIHVETPDGEPVENAEITVDGGMPQHGHGLPTAPQVTEYLGNGDYLVEGMKFNMSGWWTLTFDIDAEGATDDVTFNLILE
jgi:hypothetical protein